LTVVGMFDVEQFEISGKSGMAAIGRKGIPSG
jgi:hypothetical protein